MTTVEALIWRKLRNFAQPLKSSVFTDRKGRGKCLVMLDDDPTPMKWSTFDGHWYTNLRHLIKPTVPAFHQLHTIRFYTTQYFDDDYFIIKLTKHEDKEYKMDCVSQKPNLFQKK